MTTLERWQRFSVIYVVGLVVLAPAGVSYALDPSGGPGWLLLGPWMAAPLVQTLIALRLYGPRGARPFIAAIGGALGLYVLTYAALPLLSMIWDAMALLIAWVMAVAGPVVAGAALAQLLASAMLHAGYRLFIRGDAQAGLEARRTATGPGRDARVTVSIAAAVAGGPAGLALFAWLCFWGMDGVWTDAIYVLAFGAPLSALAACAAFLAWFLGREGG